MSDNDNIATSPRFRAAILALLLYSDWLTRYGVILEPDHFPVDAERDVVRWVNGYYNTYQVPPTDADIDEGLNDNPLLDTIYEAWGSDLSYAADVALEYAQTQAMKLAIMASVEDINSGKLARIRERVEDALAVGQDNLDLGYELVQDAEQWLYDEVRGQRHPTGWPRIDRAMSGGLVGGEYGLIMAPPNQGKTTALINIGYAMAGLVGAANVLHITYEMPTQKVLKRYAMRVTGRRFIRSESSRSDLERRYIDELRQSALLNLKARLRVAKPARTLDAIRGLIDNLTSEGFDTQALIVDYPDLMVPPRHRKERRFELADLARGSREIAEDYDIPVWGATQAGRQALNKEVITIADIAEAVEKAAIADVIIALCQTRDEQKLKQGRLFAAKMRDAEARFFVPVKMDFSKQVIVQRGR